MVSFLERLKERKKNPMTPQEKHNLELEMSIGRKHHHRQREQEKSDAGQLLKKISSDKTGKQLEDIKRIHTKAHVDRILMNIPTSSKAKKLKAKQIIDDTMKEVSERVKREPMTTNVQVKRIVKKPMTTTVQVKRVGNHRPRQRSYLKQLIKQWYELHDIIDRGIFSPKDQIKKLISKRNSIQRSPVYKEFIQHNPEAKDTREEFIFVEPPKPIKPPKPEKPPKAIKPPKAEKPPKEKKITKAQQERDAAAHHALPRVAWERQLRRLLTIVSTYVSQMLRAKDEVKGKTKEAYNASGEIRQLVEEALRRYNFGKSEMDKIVPQIKQLFRDGIENNYMSNEELTILLNKDNVGQDIEKYKKLSKSNFF